MTLPDDWPAWRAQTDLDAYEARWAVVDQPHGEADLVAGWAPASVLDAGCGTGRVAVELARRGIDVVGVDADEDLLARARAKASSAAWLHADLAGLDLGRRFDVVLLAGNVVPYIDPGRRAAAVAACARHVAPGGRLVAGFVLRPDWPSLADYDGWIAGLELEHRFATWAGAPYAGGDYAVSVSRVIEPAGGCGSGPAPSTGPRRARPA